MNEDIRKRIQEKLNQLNQKSTGNNNTGGMFWKLQAPAEGASEGPSSTIRVVNYPFTEEDDPFPELYFHYNLGTPILCPKYNNNMTCPACSFVSELYKGTDKDKEQAKKFRATNRYYAVVVDRADEEPTPKYWGFGVTVYRELLDKCVNPEYSHFMDTNKGIDITVKFVKEAGKRWPNTNLSFSRSDTPLAKSDKEVKKILDKLNPIDQVFKPLTSSEIQKRLNGVMDFGEEEAESVSAETVRGGTVSETQDSSEDVDKAFEEALSS